MIRRVALDLDHHLGLLTARAARRLGARGAALCLFGLFDLLWSWSLLDPTSSRTVFGAPSFRVIVRMGSYLDRPHPFLPWAVMMATVGVFLFWQAWVDDDRAGYAAALFIKVGWMIAVIASWPAAGILIVRTLGIFLVLTGLVMVCALGLPVRED